MPTLDGKLTSRRGSVRTSSLYYVLVFISLFSSILLLWTATWIPMKNPNDLQSMAQYRRRRFDHPLSIRRGMKNSNLLTNSSSSTLSFSSSEKNELTVKKLWKEEDNDGTAKSDTNQQEQYSQNLLSCKKYGGPFDDAFSSQTMAYWSDIPSDAKYLSPFHPILMSKDPISLTTGKVRNDRKYLTFEPDGGGWNNIRMAMETVVVLAVAMGRTLVMPPAQRIYLLGKDAGRQKIHFSFADFFHLDLVDREHEGLDIISTEEFLTREAGNFRHKDTGEVMFPPENRTNWDGLDPVPLKEWMRNVSLTPLWQPDKCIVVFPTEADDNDPVYWTNLHANASHMSVPADKITPVNASIQERMAEALAERDLCLYTKEMQEERFVHFMCYHKMQVRLLVHFYAFAFFEDWQHQMWAHRFVRDHLRYIDELQCAAARVVEALIERAKSRDRVGNPEGYFDTFHIRRGDFQYKDMTVDALALYDSCKDVIPENATVFVATDERNKTFFLPLAQHYDIVYLDDFKKEIGELNSNYYGMLDQLIASKGRTFVGTYYSTFTGYINRMRGYYVTKHKLEGYKDGTMRSYYFYPKHRKNAMKKYEAVHQPFWAQEFPTAWRDIDHGIGEI